MAGKKAKHLVHDEWMTVKEAAERLGVKWRTIEMWRTRNRRPDGKRALLVEAWDHIADVNAGRYDNYPGRTPRKYAVRGRIMTVRQAAEALRVPVKTIRSYMSRHSCGLDTAWRYYTEKRQRKAEKRILRIIRGG